MKILIVSLLLAGCSSAPLVQTFADALGASYISVDVIAENTHRLCRNEVPLGECAPDAPLGTEAKEDVRMALEHVLDALDHARDLYVQGHSDVAQDRLAQAQALLSAVQRTLTRYGR